VQLSPGEGVVEVSRRPTGSVVTRLATCSPLRLLTPKNHGTAAWIVVTSYGGGLVDGDALSLRIRVGAGAAAYLATQSSTKVYPGHAAQTACADIADDALLVALPDPIVPFAGAAYAQRATIRLAPRASLIWLESLVAGRTARGERWLFDSYRSHTRIERHGAALALDGLVLDPRHGPLASRIGEFDALATLIAVGPRAAPLRADLAGATGDVLIAPSPIGDDGALIRVAAPGAESLARALRALLAPTVILLGDDPFARKGSLAWDNAMR
jgi:urease accessory protein